MSRGGSEVRGNNLSGGEAEERQSVQCTKERTNNWVNQQLQEEPDNVAQQPGAHVLSASHIAARQVIGHNLPKFSGDPKDWPLFIAQYENSTLKCNFSNDENLVRLQRSLTGPALDAVRFNLLNPELVPSVVSTLRTLYGRPDVIITSLIRKIRQEPSPKPGNLSDLIKFSLEVKNLTATMVATKNKQYLNDVTLMSELIHKLPSQIMLDWALFKKRSPSELDLLDFGEWLYDIAEAASQVVSPNLLNINNERRTEKRSRYVNATDSISNSRSQQNHLKVKCMCCKLDHNMSECGQFMRLTRPKRWAYITEHKLCKICFGCHKWQQCRAKKECLVDGCKVFHHPLLHNGSKLFSQGQDRISAEAHDTMNERVELRSSDCLVHGRVVKSVMFRIIPVVLRGPTGCVDTYAFLDEGSSLTMIEEELAEKIGVNGEMSELCLRWTGGTSRIEPNSKVVSLGIGPVSGRAGMRIHGVRTVKKLKLPSQTINANDLQQKYKHLRGLPLPSYENAMPGILIGLDNWRAAVPLVVKEGASDEPVATKTRLGWTVGGPIDAKHSSMNIIRPSFHVCECSCEANDEERLDQMIKKFYEQEKYGVTPQENILESNEDERARELMKATTEKLDDQYQIGLLWRFDNINLPDSYPMALQRLACLERRMKRDPELKRKLIDVINDYTNKGYIQKVQRNEIQDNSRVWYLPVFAVKNPNKPGKFRIVWDAAAKVGGVSLNDVLLKGPDLLTSLFNVLLAFREKRIAICGDLKEMFHQVKIRPEDRNAQRFLWRDGETDREPDIYVMNVMTFGATCSPTCAQYIKNLNATRFTNEKPRAAQAIIECHYVDDWLDCTDDEESAIELAREVRDIHGKGGFQIHNWQSNSERVIEALGGSSRGDSNSDDGILRNEAKVLGMWWSTSDDQFQFYINRNKFESQLLNGTRRPTKREVLKVIMSVFDPLGLIGQFLVIAKILMQKIWRSQIGWDDELRDAEWQNWLEWINLLTEIENIRIPRCYLGDRKSNEVEAVELHVFVDSSEEASAAAAYFRFQFKDERRVILAGSKTKIAPLRAVSIPRLELQAAVLGARFSVAIINSQRFKIDRCIFWSDSRTVLNWLNSDHRKYKQYVALRVSEIAELTNIRDWRWLPSSKNVADEATKWRGKSTLCSTSRWFNGPKFLQQNEAEWPENIYNSRDPVEEASEIREVFVHAHSKRNIAEGVPKVSRFSSWKKLVKTQAFVLRFIRNIAQKKKLRKRKKIEPLDCDELESAEKLLIRCAQLESYGDEISTLMFGSKPVEKTSRIYNLSPYLDEDNILRHRGRIDRIKGVAISVKRPIILCNSHPMTKLVVENYHQRYSHHNNETVLNEIRQRFIIPKLRALIKKIQRSCQFCKNARAKPSVPEMADLPEARLSPFLRPFTHTGLDYFGPIEVNLGRRVEKRWGMLLTCLTTRAVHMEVAYSLSTDSCIMALRAFIARRGQPTDIYSDNGTNFVGTERELRKELEKITRTDMLRKFDHIRWHFNPPSAPHMGGSWERLVRSVKVSLYEVLPCRKPTDELLRTILAEVENVVNSRPLSYVPLEAESDEALTPNHFLLGCSNGMKACGELVNNDLLLRRNWKISQIIANRFWSRWLSEYLPTITRRTKWFETRDRVRINDVVVIHDEKDRNSWAKGRVIDVIPGRDGNIRTAVVQTVAGVFTRPVAKLAILDVSNDVVQNEDIREASIQTHQSPEPDKGVRRYVYPLTGGEDVVEDTLSDVATNSSKTAASCGPEPRKEEEAFERERRGNKGTRLGSSHFGDK